MKRDVTVTLPGSPTWLRTCCAHHGQLCDLLKAADMHDETYTVLCGCTRPESPHRFVPNPLAASDTVALAGTVPIHSWSEYYALRGLSTNSPVAVLLTWPLTLYYVLQELGLTSLARPVVIHYLGPEKEVLFLPLFRELLALIPGARLTIEMIGPLAIALPPPIRLQDEHGGHLGISVRSGLYHTLDLPAPDVAFAPNAGLAVAGYAERWPATLRHIRTRRIPCVFTDYSEQSVEKGLRLSAECARLTASCGVRINPFRQPLWQPRVHGGSVALPTLSNGFLAAFQTPPGAFAPIAPADTVDAAVADVSDRVSGMGLKATSSAAAAAAAATAAAAAAAAPAAASAMAATAPAATAPAATAPAATAPAAATTAGAAAPAAAVSPSASALDLASFDADAPQPFEAFFAVAQQLGAISALQLEVLRRAVQTGRRTERQCMSEYWARVAHGVGMSARYRWRCELSEAALAVAPAEVRARAQLLSPRHSGEWRDETGRFSLSKCLEPLVTPRWIRLKALGNDALQAGECALAAEWYARAATLTEHTMSVGTFFDVLDASRNHAARRLAAEQDDLWGVVHRALPDCPRRLSYDSELEALAQEHGLRDYAQEPNLPKATCRANAAAARLRQASELDTSHAASLTRHPDLPQHICAMHREARDGLLHKALADADAAAIACPDYQKGHFRVAQALRALQAAAATASPPQREYADAPGLDQVDSAMRSYQIGAGRLPWCGVAAMLSGFMTPPEYELVYAPAYFDHEVRQIRRARAHTEPALGGRPAPLRLTVLASLVPSMGGQNLLLNVETQQLVGGEMRTCRHDGLGFTALDASHGEQVEQPPHGHASALSLSRYPQPLSAFLADLTHAGVDIDALCLGQALTDQVERVAAALAVQPGYGHIRVYSSATTHASKLAAPGGRDRELKAFLQRRDGSRP